MRKSLSWALVVAGLLVSGGDLQGQESSATDTGSVRVRTCPEGELPRADFGIRYRFTAGDFRDEPGRPRWVRFLTEPVVTEVDPAGPADGRLRPNDVLVAVQGHLITTREGSRLFWFADPGEVRLDVSRGGRAETIQLRPARVCTPYT